MTTFEHAMLGIDLVIASGLDRRYGWRLVAMAGVAAVLPDWDGISFSIHRAWGHGILPCFLVALMWGLMDYRFDLISRAASRMTRLVRVTVPDGLLDVRTGFSKGEAAIWCVVSVIATQTHAPCDMIVSGTKSLPDWEVLWFWPFSSEGYVYPLISWGDVGITAILFAGMFVMLRYREQRQYVACGALALSAVYAVVSGLM
jgi:hypothetical protein